MHAAFSEQLPVLLVQVILIVLLSRLLSRGMRAMRQPMVIAEMVAGIALGPSFLGRVWPHASAVLFPRESVAALSIVSKVGLVLFMFLVGLRFDVKHLRGHGK